MDFLLQKGLEKFESFYPRLERSFEVFGFPKPHENPRRFQLFPLIAIQDPKNLEKPLFNSS